MVKDKLFYVGQRAFIDRNGDVLILNDPIYGLDFPGGKIQEGETDFIEALKREVHEETALEIEVGSPFAVWQFMIGKHHRYAGKQVYLVGFKCRYLSGEVKLSVDHDNFRWVNKNNYHEIDDDSPHFKALEKYFQ